ncbi:MAG: PASTA domain-containing protein [Paludibacteraceae bacterium]|nr:PASTA domain-containing protein [Paludibacteraceae bacterium]
MANKPNEKAKGKSSFAKKILFNVFTINIALLLAVIVAAYFGTLYWIDSYTNHGQEIVVPELEGMTIDEASKMLKEKGLYCEIVDSLFVDGKKASAIVEQTPSAGAKVKAERTIYVVINTNTPRKVALPDLMDVSVRQAEAIVNSIGLKVSDYEYVPSEYKGLVEDVKYDNKIINPGTRITVGSSIVFCVGMGLSNEEVPVISLRGLTLDQAKARAHTASLNVGSVFYDEQPKSEIEKTIYVVYKQQPITGSSVKMGKPLTIYLTKDRKFLETPEEVFVDTTAAQNPNEDDLLLQ